MPPRVAATLRRPRGSARSTAPGRDRASIAGCRSTASSMSAKRPSTCGRIASNSSRPASPTTGSLSTETAKWFAQKCTSRSTNGLSLASADDSRAPFIHHIIVANAAPERTFWPSWAARLRKVRMSSASRRLQPLALGAALRSRLGDIVGKLTDHLAARGHGAQRLRARLEAVELRQQPALWIGRLGSLGRAPRPKRLRAMATEFIDVSLGRKMTPAALNVSSATT